MRKHKTVQKLSRLLHYAIGLVVLPIENLGEVGRTVIYLVVTFILLWLGLYELQRFGFLSEGVADRAHIWFQFITGNWPLLGKVQIDRVSLEFCALLAAKTFLVIAPIYGILRLFRGFATLERRERMRYLDLLNLRDGLIMDAMVKDIPEGKREQTEKRLREAFEEADECLYNEQISVLFDREHANALRQHLRREIKY